MIRQYHRMLTMDNSRLTNKIYMWYRTLNDNNIITTWSSEVYDILRQCNLNNIYDSNQIFNIRACISDIKQTLYKIQIEKLRTECNSKPKLRTFILFKDYDNTPSYLTQSLSFHQRRSLAKLRLGCLPLQIETGRYLIPRVPEYERICKICTNLETNNNEYIESEYHFLFICKAFHNDRTTWLNKLTLPEDFYNLQTADKFRLV